MADRRRVNAPTGGTTPVRFAPELLTKDETSINRPHRHRAAQDIRKICSAYLEFESTSPTNSSVLLAPTPSLKLTCSVHGPRPLPRSASFSPHMQLTTHVKFAPFASRHRRGYLRDAGERDLAAHLETALRGVIVSERWPKSSLEIIVTILEGEESAWWGDEAQSSTGAGSNSTLHGMMSILSGCITVASAAVVDAGIDCIDVVSGGVAALIKNEPGSENQSNEIADVPSGYEVVLDPTPSEHRSIVAICAVGYLKSSDEITEMWINGGASLGGQHRALTELLVDGAVQAASASVLAIREAVKSS